MFPFLCAFSRQLHVVEIDVQKYIIFDMPVYRVHRLRQILNSSEVPITGIFFFLEVNAKPTPLDYVIGVFLVIIISFLLISAAGV